MPGPVILAVEGGSFSKAIGGRALMALLLTEGIEPRNLSFTTIDVDGLDATEKVVRTLGFGGASVDLVLSDSMPIAGFNMIDPRAVLEGTGTPTAFVLPRKPDAEGVENALRKHFLDWRKRLEILTAAGPLIAHKLGDGEVFIECLGIKVSTAAGLLGRVTIFGKVPEPIRLARMMAREATHLVGATGTLELRS